MSHRLHELDRLAGLDAMVFHFNFDAPSFSSRPNGAIEPVPILVIPVGDKRGSVERAGRSPLTDKSRDMNTSSLDNPISPKRKSSVQRNLTEIKYIPTEPHARPSTLSSFSPLPPLPSTSSLQLPSFLELSSQLDQPWVPSSNTSASPPPPPADTTPEGEDARRQPLDAAVCSISAFSHPNSPYVPWSSPVREEILHPITPASQSSAFTSSYSRPYSRSGARAPEPANYVERDSHRADGLPDVRRSWRSFRQVVKKGIRLVVKRIGCFTESRKASSPHYPSPEPAWEEVSPPTPYFSHPRRRASLESVETTSLATWLAEKRRESLEYRDSPQRRMTLEEYERIGSWLDVSEDTKSDVSDNDIPIYDIVSPGTTSFGGNITASTDHRASVLCTLQQLDELGNDHFANDLFPASDRTVSLRELSTFLSHSYRHSCPRRRSLDN